MGNVEQLTRRAPTGQRSTHAQKKRGCKDYSYSIEPHCAPAHATFSHLLIISQLLTSVHLEHHHLHHCAYYRMIALVTHILQI